MKWNWQRVTLALVDGFAAISAIGGGYAVMVGTIKPGGDLASGPFGWLISDYSVAGEILLVVTGGTALAALVATLLSRAAGAGFSAAAGMVMVGWIIGEVVIVGTHWLQLIYFVIGLAMLALAVMVQPAQMRATAHRLHLV